jgi:hypothetical protein
VSERGGLVILQRVRRRGGSRWQGGGLTLSNSTFRGEAGVRRDDAGEQEQAGPGGAARPQVQAPLQGGPGGPGPARELQPVNTPELPPTPAPFQEAQRPDR